MISRPNCPALKTQAVRPFARTWTDLQGTCATCQANTDCARACFYVGRQYPTHTHSHTHVRRTEMLRASGAERRRGLPGAGKRRHGVHAANVQPEDPHVVGGRTRSPETGRRRRDSLGRKTVTVQARACRRDAVTGCRAGWLVPPTCSRRGPRVTARRSAPPTRTTFLRLLYFEEDGETPPRDVSGAAASVAGGMGHGPCVQVRVCLGTSVRFMEAVHTAPASSSREHVSAPWPGRAGSCPHVHRLMGRQGRSRRGNSVTKPMGASPGRSQPLGPIHVSRHV